MYQGISQLHNWVSCGQLNPQSKLLEHCNSQTKGCIFSPSPPPPPLVQCCIMHSLFFNTIKNQHCLGERAGEQKQVLTTTSRENFPTLLEEVDYELLEQRAIFAPNILKCPKIFCPRLQFLKERKNFFFHLSLELAWEQKWNPNQSITLQHLNL